MRFFTALLACALVMGACSKSGIEPAADGTGGTRAPEEKQDKVIVFHKVVQVGENEFIPAEAGQFKFELWGLKKNGKGEAELLGSFETDENGDVVVDFSDDLKGQGRDKYYFTEVFDTPEEAAKWEELDDQPFTLQASWGAQWDDYEDFEFGPDGPTIVNIPIPEDEPGDGYANKDAVTLTNDADAPLFGNKNNGRPHPNFCYAVLSREILEAGDKIKLDMIKNGTHEDVGDAFVKLVDGKLVIHVEDGELDTNTFEIYEGVLNNNGNTSVDLSIDYPAGEGDFCIYVFGHYSWN